MSAVVLRPLQAGDLALVSDKPLPFRLRGYTMVVDGEVVGVAGLVFRFDDSVWIGAFLTPAARARAVTLHRGGLQLMDDARRLKVPDIFALADPTQPRSEAWLARLGFRRSGLFEDGRPVWRWSLAEEARPA